MGILGSDQAGSGWRRRPKINIIRNGMILLENWINLMPLNFGGILPCVCRLPHGQSPFVKRAIRVHFNYLFIYYNVILFGWMKMKSGLHLVNVNCLFCVVCTYSIQSHLLHSFFVAGIVLWIGKILDHISCWLLAEGKMCANGICVFPFRGPFKSVRPRKNTRTHAKSVA